MSIRAYRSSDEDAVIRVWLEATIPGQPFIPEGGWRAQEPIVRRELLPAAQTWVVDEGGEVLAFVSIIDGVIGGLFTDPGHQERGYGRSLVHHARERVRPLFVEVFEANTPALAFYRHRGFVDHERRVDDGTGLPLLLLRMNDAAPSEGV